MFWFARVWIKGISEGPRQLFGHPWDRRTNNLRHYGGVGSTVLCNVKLVVYRVSSVYVHILLSLLKCLSTMAEQYRIWEIWYWPEGPHIHSHFQEMCWLASGWMHFWTLLYIHFRCVYVCVQWIPFNPATLGTGVSWLEGLGTGVSWLEGCPRGFVL